jgi:hypothetical protein
VRGTHSTVVKNPSPSYTVPATHQQRLWFIRKLVTLSQTRNVLLSDVAVLARSWSSRKKRIYRDRANAIRALHAVFCEHVNLATHQIEISLRNASDAAGLSTISDTEHMKARANPNYTPKVSMSRASRALADMVELGWIRADAQWQVWDKEAGMWTDKYFEATEVFFTTVGVTASTVQKQRSQRLAWYKQMALEAGVSAEEVGRMSVNSLKKIRQQRWRQKAFERRAKEQARKKLHRELAGKSREAQRAVAQRRVLAMIDVEATDLATFKDLVNKELAFLRRATGTSPPA